MRGRCANNVKEFAFNRNLDNMIGPTIPELAISGSTTYAWMCIQLRTILKMLVYSSEHINNNMFVSIASMGKNMFVSHLLKLIKSYKYLSIRKIQDERKYIILNYSTTSNMVNETS
jgi:hypothetical protein